MSKVLRPPIQYHGGKWLLAEWIISHFPHHTCYVEPFAGGASCLFRKQPAKFEVLNDLNNDVITFFDVLRTRTDDLIRAIELTPYSREELRRALRASRLEPVSDPLEQARQFYVRCWMSFASGVGKSSTGWRYQIGASGDSGASATRLWNRTEHLWAAAARLKQVQIECDDARAVMVRFNSHETLFYLDPPYVHSTRHTDNAKMGKGYKYEMSDEDHRALAETAHQMEGFVVVSGYPSSLYDELYKGWACITTDSRNLKAGKQVECLWLSPRVTAMESLPLWNMRGGVKR